MVDKIELGTILETFEDSIEAAKRIGISEEKILTCKERIEAYLEKKVKEGLE